MKIKLLFLALSAFCLMTPSLSYANLNELKAYREVNPELKADCTYCHLDEKPKKEDGKHDLNAYGLKAKETFDAEKVEGMTKDQICELYAKVFKQLGRHDEFKAK
ncbi:MAG: hypothetical protein NUV91_04205 [Candidatus Omnitrophica bacterium]|nr:hypothetical protein [Candidatus Omnitrophota bacterium]